MRYQGQKPVMDALLKDAGFPGLNPVDALTGGLVAAKAAEGAPSVSPQASDGQSEAPKASAAAR
jgi:hypothetical protein